MSEKKLQQEKLNAEVVSVYPNKVKIVVDKLEDFKIADESLKVGSYLRISDNENAVLIAIIENFSIEVNDAGKRTYIIEANPLGIIKDGKFTRGGDSIAIPPKKVEPATVDEIKNIYEQSINEKESFIFCTLSSNQNINIPVNGNKFFNNISLLLVLLVLENLIHSQQLFKKQYQRKMENLN